MDTMLRHFALRRTLLVPVLLAASLLAASAHATIMGPGQITASTTVPSQGGFTIDQICDGLLTAPGWYNGFAVNPGIIGTIRLDLTTPQALGDFVLWNDVNVSAEGISQFRLDFFDAANLPLGSTPVLTGPIGQTAPSIYPFPVVENVKRVDLVVLTLNPSPRLEIREVAFNWSDVVSVENTTLSGVKALFR
jgi:hypothetical protein